MTLPPFLIECIVKEHPVHMRSQMQCVAPLGCVEMGQDWWREAVALWSRLSDSLHKLWIITVPCSHVYLRRRLRLEAVSSSPPPCIIVFVSTALSPLSRKPSPFCLIYNYLSINKTPSKINDHIKLIILWYIKYHIPPYRKPNISVLSLANKF
jgi:hypothetical protein